MEWVETTGQQEYLGKSSVVVEPPLPQSSTRVGPVHGTPKGTPQGTPVGAVASTSGDTIMISHVFTEFKDSSEIELK